MVRIGILSDTHSYVHPGFSDFFKNCDEIWHAGDIGDPGIIKMLEDFKPLKTVYGNIDSAGIRRDVPEYRLFMCEEVKVFIIHIGGYPGNYNSRVRSIIQTEKPGLVVTGHSHILKVMYDHENKHLHINPGAAGRYGLHKSITMVRFEIEGCQIKNLEVLDIERNSSKLKPV